VVLEFVEPADIVGLPGAVDTADIVGLPGPTSPLPRVPLSNYAFFSRNFRINAGF